MVPLTHPAATAEALEAHLRLVDVASPPSERA
jgi:hypothetical protein